jgi:hypothetical protein
MRTRGPTRAGTSKASWEGDAFVISAFLYSEHTIPRKAKDATAQERRLQKQWEKVHGYPPPSAPTQENEE